MKIVMSADRCVQVSDLSDGDGNRAGRVIWLQCPGCDGLHCVYVEGEDGSRPRGATWDWNGDIDNLTVSPSILVYERLGVDGPPYAPRCHSFVADHAWQYLPDCGHALAGSTVPLVPLPDWKVFDA